MGDKRVWLRKEIPRKEGGRRVFYGSIDVNYLGKYVTFRVSRFGRGGLEYINCVEEAIQQEHETHRRVFKEREHLQDKGSAC